MNGQRIALFVRHKTLHGKREEVRKIWEKHMRDAISANPDHTAYFYCYDDSDPDVICAFQQYRNAEASRDFLAREAYQAYLNDVEPLLAEPPVVASLTPVWEKTTELK